MTAIEKCSRAIVIEVYISRRSAPMRMLYIVTLAFIFKVRKFLKIYKSTIYGKE